MKIDNALLDELAVQAQTSPRLRMNMDLRDSADDQSQRMLNALEPGTVLPIHRHRKTAETVAILRGRAVQHLCDEEGRLVESVLLEPLAAGCPVRPGMTESGEGITGRALPMKEDGHNVTGPVPAMNVEKGQWHRLESLETGTVIVEFKNGPYEPISPADILSM